MKKVVVLLALIAASGAGSLEAQSMFNSAGMGLPVEALGGRARALGNLGIGLRGRALMPTDPAAAAQLVTPTGVIAGQPSWVDFSDEASGTTGRFQGNRFPLLGLAFPAVGGMVSVQLGSVFDQEFRAERPVTVTLLSGPTEATDVFEQDGSLSSLSIGYARRLTGSVSAGLTAGRYAGSVVRFLEREFPTSAALTGVEAYQAGGTWDYSGYSLTGGAAAEFGSFAHVAGSVTWSSALDAKAAGSTQGADRSFDLPVQLRVGASFVLTPGLTVVVSGVRADWSGIEDDLATPSRVGSTTGFGAGVELSRASVFGKQAPLRLGFRRTQLPFSFGSEDASERVFAGGFGLVVNETSGIVLAEVDLAVERGLRTGGDVTERFWRGTVSLIVSGF